MRPNRATMFALVVLSLLSAVYARHNAMWDSKFDVPNGFRAYQPKQSRSHRATIDDSYGVEGFLDEGIDDNALLAPTHLTKPAHSAKHHHKHEKEMSSEHHASNHHHRKHAEHHKHHHRRHNVLQPQAFLEIEQTIKQATTEQYDPTIAHPVHHTRSHHERLGMGSAPLPPGIGGPYTQPPPYPRSGVNTAPSVTLTSGGARPNTFPGVPVAPQLPDSPSLPSSELAWMLESDKHKGFDDDPPQKLTTQDALESLKGFFKKGVKAMEAMENSPEPAKEATVDGFAGWPQPFWWTRPPAWLDDVPAWMQRLQLKRAGSMHKAATYG